MKLGNDTFACLEQAPERSCCTQRVACNSSISLQKTCDLLASVVQKGFLSNPDEIAMGCTEFS
jgi:hypothetical protein